MNEEIESLNRRIALSHNAIRVNGSPDNQLLERLADLQAQLKEAKAKSRK